MELENAQGSPYFALIPYAIELAKSLEVFMFSGVALGYSTLCLLDGETERQQNGSCWVQSDSPTEPGTSELNDV